MGSYVYKVTNLSQSIQSFQGMTFAPNASITVRRLSPGVITAFKKDLILLEPNILDIDVFKIINLTQSNLAVEDLTLRPQEAGWVEGLSTDVLTLWQRGLLLIDPNPLDVPVFDGTSPVGSSPVGVGGGGSDSNFQTATNADGVTLQFGYAVYSDSNGLNVMRAQGNDVNRKSVWGLVSDASIAPGDTGVICCNGVITGSNSQWSSATGIAGGLMLNAPYYLSLGNPGRITPFGPVAIEGEDLWVVQVGYAISSTQLKVEIQQSIKL